MKLRRIKSHGRGSSSISSGPELIIGEPQQQLEQPGWAEFFEELSSSSATSFSSLLLCTKLRSSSDSSTTQHNSDEPPTMMAATNENIEIEMTQIERTVHNSNLKLKKRRTANYTTTTTTTTTIKRHFYIFCFAIFLLIMGVVDGAPTGVVTKRDTSSIENSRKVPPTLAILDGLVSYSAGGANMSMSDFRDLSRSAFLSLQGTPIEAKLPAYQIDGEGDGVTSDEENQDLLHVEHMTRHHRKKNRRPGGIGSKKEASGPKAEIILEGRKHALMQLADPNGLKMTQKCDGQKFKQRVRAEGCLTKVVVNRLCHGTCASFFIPRMHSKKLKAAFKSCATCAPSDYDFVDITLDCPGQDPPTATRTIVKVKSCKCREVSISSLYA